MKTDSMFDILKKFGIKNKDEYVSQAFARNIGLLTIAEQKTLSMAKVAIPGLGGVGGVHLITMARTGIGKFHIADFDIFEPANINRQFGARVPDFGRLKLEVMKEQALSINPYLEITSFQDGINESNIDQFLDGVDVVLDGLDFFKFDIRRLLFKKAAEKGIYVITAGPMGFSSAMLVFAPDGMGFDEYFNITDNMLDKDKYLSFAMGLTPRPTHIKYMDLKKVDLDSKAGPSLNIACQICSGMAGTEALKIILKKGKVRVVPQFSQFDPFLNVYKKGYLSWGNKNPIQRIKKIVVKYLLGKNKTQLRVNIPKRPKILLKNGEDIPKPVLSYLIKAGVQAPSGDNCQPWKFDIEKNQIKLFLDRGRDQSFFNVNQIASTISCGAVIENICIASTAFGIKGTIEYDSDPEYNLMATIHLSSEQEEIDGLSDYIWHRHTNRKFYKRSSLPDTLIDRLTAIVSNYSGAGLCVVTDRKKIKKIAKIIYQIDRIRTEHRPLHEHLMSMIRFTDEEVLDKMDGFPLKNLEAGLAGELFLKITKPWSVMNIMNKAGIGRMVAFHSYQGIINSSGVGLLTIEGRDDKDFLLGGQALERVWLTLTSLGIQMQPMTAITLFYQRLMMNGRSEFQIKHQKVLEKVKKEYENLFDLSDTAPIRSHVMLFRFGYGEEIDIRTLRKMS